MMVEATEKKLERPKHMNRGNRKSKDGNEYRKDRNNNNKLAEKSQNSKICCKGHD